MDKVLLQPPRLGQCLPINTDKNYQSIATNTALSLDKIYCSSITRFWCISFNSSQEQLNFEVTILFYAVCYFIDDSCVSYQEYVRSHQTMPPEVADKMFHHFDHNTDGCLMTADMSAEFHLIDHNGTCNYGLINPCLLNYLNGRVLLSIWNSPF